jgi:hypothetical protein
MSILQWLREVFVGKEQLCQVAGNHAELGEVQRRQADLLTRIEAIEAEANVARERCNEQHGL